MTREELQRIRDTYSRRTGKYEPWDPWVLLTRQQLERSMIRKLDAAGMFPAHDKSLLDVGCGTGTHLLFFLSLGFDPSRMTGIDLLEQRIQIARSRLPDAIRLQSTDAATFAGPSTAFDVVFHSMLISSVLDQRMRQEIAANMWRLVRPGGGVLWYDFTWNNPRNNDVRRVPLREIQQLFPDGKLDSSRVTLAPPIARALCKLHPALYGIASAAGFLKTHVLVWIGKGDLQELQ